MKISDIQREKIHRIKYGIEILCYEGGNILIVGDECYQFVKEFSLTVDESQRTLSLTLDADAFIAEFMAQAQAKASHLVKRGEKNGHPHKKYPLQSSRRKSNHQKLFR